MSAAQLEALFGLTGKVAVVTGGSGVLGSAMAHGLAQAGARVGVLARGRARAEAVAAAINEAGGEALALPADVLQPSDLEAALALLLQRWGRLDILINGAGGNIPAATVPDDGSFFDLPPAGLQQVVELNLHGTLLPSQVLGAAIAAGSPAGCIVNVSSLAVGPALSRVVGYGVAKAGVEQFTRWLAFELARKHGGRIRVNAIAPGFFLAEQNQSLLVDPSGELTQRGQAIIDHTPLGRFGRPEELVSTLVWLCSPGAAFVNGTVIAVDGGFGAFSGV